MIARILSSRKKCTICDRTLYPIYYLLLILGLNQSIRQNNSWLFRIYSWFIFCLLVFTTFRKFNQIGVRPDGSRESLVEFIANPRSLITLCNALIMFSGLLASCQLYNLGGRRLKPLKILCQFSLNARSKESERRQFIINTFLAVFSAVLALIMAASYALSKWGYILYILGTPNLNTETIFCVLLDSYALFVSRAAITAVAILFYQHCSVIRRSIKHLINEMLPKNQEECPLPEASLKKIHDSQISYQMIFNGKTVIEDYYSFVLFYSYGVCIPIFCFLMFVVMSSQSICWSEILSIVIWIINAFLVLLLFSIPAFMIHEDGDRLVAASFRMYHETFHEERDLTVLAQMSFFTFQIHSTKLTLSACNYFYMDRSILLSLFSAILTYFLILWEFDIKNRNLGSAANHTLHS
uniref:Gustatory receptor n=1 Tax=Caenorhabditis japonica TaxID=281687 RepID=A0A8R1HZ16_CAEJA